MRAGEACEQDLDCRIVKHVLIGETSATGCRDRLRDGVDSDTLGNQVLSESSSEADNCSLGGGIVDHLGSATESNNRRSVDDSDLKGQGI